MWPFSFTFTRRTNPQRRSGRIYEKVARLDYGKTTKNHITHSDLWSGPHKNVTKNAK